MNKKLIRTLLALLLAGLAPVGWADRLPREVVINDVEFMYVPAGYFWHVVETGGQRSGQLSEPWYREVRIWLDDYYIGKYEARARDFQRFMAAGAAGHADQYAAAEERGCSVRRGAAGAYYLTKPEFDLPATHLTWRLADEMARWLGFRLPTEMEWVKAARGDDRRMWPWGNEYPDDTYAGFGSATSCNAVSVGSFANGVSPYGVHDLAGNAYEYVADWVNKDFDASLKDGDRNPRQPDVGTPDYSGGDGTEGQVKIVKGGRWASPAEGVDVFHRRTNKPDGPPFICFGTRFALDAAVVRRHLADGTARVARE